LPLLMFFVFPKRNTNIWVKALFFYVVISFINDSVLLSIYTTSLVRHTYNILSAYTIIEYSIFTLFLFSVIDKKLFRTTILVSAVGFYAFSTNYLITSEEGNFDSLSASIESILIIMYCVFYLFDQLDKPQVIFIYQDPNFW